MAGGDRLATCGLVGGLGDSWPTVTSPGVKRSHRGFPTILTVLAARREPHAECRIRV
jgi:hypothetical protein